jgi:Xaa-Pro aminopeptidase
MSNKKKTYKDKLSDIRVALSAEGVDAFLVPREDEWQGEYVPERAERLSWLTGFTGSAGMAIISKDKAALYSDSRYTVQMAKQVDPSLFDIRTTDADTGEEPSKWIKDNLSPNAKVGYDPRIHTVAEIEHFQKKLAGETVNLVEVSPNPVDQSWDDQPGHPGDKVFVQDIKYAGLSSEDKRKSIAGELKESGVHQALVTQPDSIAWLLNIRGSDVPNTPLVLSYALVHDSGEVDWFVPGHKLTEDVKKHLGSGVRLHELVDAQAVLKKSCAGKKVLFDKRRTAVWFRNILEGVQASLEFGDDPIVHLKAIKNSTEIEKLIEAHVQDGVALVKFWKWVEEQAAGGALSELQAAEKLGEFRSHGQDFVGSSFDAIVGWAGNGADIHYRVTPDSSLTIDKDNLLLVDSGGQYKGGTTDNTRTVVIGSPTPEMKENFTRVLKGHIAIAGARFPEGTTGRDVDFLARQFLHKVNRVYGHGTGHGVGAFLSVHEAGAGIHKAFKDPLLPGMLISNEPGYYKVDKDGNGEYGIRIENLVLVEETGDERLKYKFNTVSLTPIDQKLIDVDLLDSDEIRWLNDYHKKVYEQLSPYLDQDEKNWLKKETAPIIRAP